MIIIFYRFQFLDFDEHPEEESSSTSGPTVSDSSPSHIPSPSLRVHHTMNTTTNPSPLIQSRQQSSFDKSPQTNAKQKRASLQEGLVNGTQDVGKLSVLRRLSSHTRSGSNASGSIASGSGGSSASLHSESDSKLLGTAIKNGRDNVNLTDYKTKRPASFAV